MQWQNFLARVGIGQTSEGFPPVWYRANAAPMEFTYFLKMERKLATAAGLNPRIRELIIRFVEAREITIEKLRCREIALEQNAILQPPKLLLDMLVGGSDNRIGHAPMSATQIGAVMTIVLDVSTIFTTRDWSVTGFLSTLAGAVAPATVK